MTSKEGFVQAYNAQAAVDVEAQIIVAHELTQCGSDQGQLVPLVKAIENNLSRKPEQASADSGYCSEPNFKALVARGIDCRSWTRPTPDSGKRKSWWTADATDAQKDRRRRLRNALPIEKASGGTGVRTDQTGTRLPPIPVAPRQESTCRVGHDLHHPQSSETFHTRKGRLTRLPCNKGPRCLFGERHFLETAVRSFRLPPTALQTIGIRIGKRTGNLQARPTKSKRAQGAACRNALRASPNRQVVLEEHGAVRR
jgi:hypothetical protein